METGTEMKTRQIDRTDRRILNLLQDSGRMSNKDLARQVNLSPTPCLRRVGMLEQSGVIKGYNAVIDPEQLGFSIRAFVQVTGSRELHRDRL